MAAGQVVRLHAGAEQAHLPHAPRQFVAVGADAVVDEAVELGVGPDDAVGQEGAALGAQICQRGGHQPSTSTKVSLSAAATSRWWAGTW